MLPDRQLLLVRRTGDRAVDTRELPAVLLIPHPDLRRNVARGLIGAGIVVGHVGIPRSFGFTKLFTISNLPQRPRAHGKRVEGRRGASLYPSSGEKRSLALPVRTRALEFGLHLGVANACLMRGTNDA